MKHAGQQFAVQDQRLFCLVLSNDDTYKREDEED